QYETLLRKPEFHKVDGLAQRPHLGLAREQIPMRAIDFLRRALQDGYREDRRLVASSGAAAVKDAFAAAVLRVGIFEIARIFCFWEGLGMNRGGDRQGESDTQKSPAQ